MTLECLESIAVCTRRTSYEVILVDNGSTDGSAQAVRERFPYVTVIEPGENLGFARANNLAAERARGSWVLLLNPDTVVLDDALDALLAAARTRGEGIYGGRTVFGDGRLNPLSCSRAMTPWSLFLRATGISLLAPGNERLNPESYGRWPRDAEREVDIVSGCLLLLPRSLWVRLGGFDPHFVMYGEEVDLCLRAARAGIPRVHIPDATIVHHGGASQRVRGRRMSLVFTAKSSEMRRHWRPGTRWFGLTMLGLWAWTRAVAYRALALVNPARFTEPAEAWRHVWRERRRWRRGFPRSGGLEAQRERVAEAA